MILLQMERQKDQIQAQERKHEEQQEEQQRKNEEQQRQKDEQQRQIDELQHQLKEFTKSNRDRRSESDIVKELKKLIHAEINGLSQCVAGNYTTNKGGSSRVEEERGFTEEKEVSFGRTFP